MLSLSFTVKMLKFALIFVFCYIQTSRQEGCSFYLFNSFDPTVLSTDFEIIYPPLSNNPDNRNITIPIDTTVIISCKGGRFDGGFTTTRTVLATCNQDSQFEAQDAIFDFTKIDCVNFNPQVARITTETCGPNARLIEVGFQIGLNIKFVPQIKICFDFENLIPLYSNYNLTKSIGFIKSYLVTPYLVDSVYNSVNIDFDTVFGNTTYHQQAINKLLGLPLDSPKYVDPVSCDPFGQYQFATPGFCFSKRPLAYRGDFVFINQHYGTYRYINVAPQWYFLDYNLDKLERNVIDFVKIIQLDLEVYTGTFEIATLPHSTTNEETKLFLYVDEKNKALALPLYFWKLIYDPINLKATVFLTVNNPHLSEEDIPKHVICEDISDNIKWLTWEKHNATKGYSYACSYEDAKAAISYLPDIVVKELLV